MISLHEQVGLIMDDAVSLFLLCESLCSLLLLCLPCPQFVSVCVCLHSAQYINPQIIVSVAVVDTLSACLAILIPPLPSAICSHLTTSEGPFLNKPVKLHLPHCIVTQDEDEDSDVPL